MRGPTPNPDSSNQMSDHLPIWIQVTTDIDGFRLDQIAQDAREKEGLGVSSKY